MSKKLNIKQGYDFSDVPADFDKQSLFKLIDPLKEDVPGLEFVVDGYCAKGLITVIGGSAGSGKSILNQYLFQKRSDELLKTYRGKAVYLTGADSSDFELRRRAKSIKENAGLYTMSLPGQFYCVATNNDFMEGLQTLIKQHGIDAVIFDTIADFHEGKLYEPDLANSTMRSFSLLAAKANVAVILITHTKKGSKVKNGYDVEDISDSRIFTTKADFVFGLKSEYQDDGTNLIELQCLKSRSAKPIRSLRALITHSEAVDHLTINPTNQSFEYEKDIKKAAQADVELRMRVAELSAEGKPQREIAREVGISLGKVNQLLKVDD